MFSDEIIASALSPRIFSLIILPTEKCNFRCTYCYEDFAAGRMKPKIVDGVKKLIERRIAGLDSLSLSWFGGEPLIAKDIVLDIGSYAHDLCMERGVNFSAGFTTNGYLLTSELFERFKNISHNEYQITLDGDEEWHDKTRVTANRGATFQTIWSNLISFRQVAGYFKIILRLHVHGDNIESVKRLYSKLREEILDDLRFRVFFHKISNLSSEGPIKEKVLNRSDYNDALRYITGGQTLSIGSRAGSSEEQLEGYICYAAKPNSLMIRANGGIGKCTVALYDDRNNIGHLNEDGTLNIANDKLSRWLNGFSNLSEKSLGCPMSSMS